MDAPVSPQVLVEGDLAKRLRGINKIVVAIHGIGSQTRGSTIRSVARQFGDREEIRLPTMPLGFFHVGSGDEAMISRLENLKEGSRLADIGFVEVFWADIPRTAADQEDTLEETKAWGRTIVSRAEAAYNRATSSEQRQLTPEDFKLASGVVDEVAETISVLENICFLSEKAGAFKFDLGQLLRDYVGDVQVVTEFTAFRRKIQFRFHSVMADIVAQLSRHGIEGPDIYIVAHSEGTVVSFLGILEALAENRITRPAAKEATPGEVSTEWIRHVRGYMTIGSPLDKHIILWPKLWEHVKHDIECTVDVQSGAVIPSAEGRWTLPSPIQWRNYYDFGDPVGFKLDSTREFLKAANCAAFDFKPDHDYGFSRYALPGKAHNDYWQDEQVFGHFIDEVVDNRSAKKVDAPRSKPLSQAIGSAIPYVLTFLLHVAAVYLLYKGVSSSIQEFSFSLGRAFLELLALSVFFTCATMAARVPRLTKETRSRVTVVIVSFALAAASVYFLNVIARSVGGVVLPEFLEPRFNNIEPRDIGIAATSVVGLLIVLSSWATPRKPRYGRRVLISLGGLLVSYIAVRICIDSGSDRNLWPAVVGGIGFVYFWWLAILIFDLTFIWHRYIRRSVAIDHLSHWHRLATTVR